MAPATGKRAAKSQAGPPQKKSKPAAHTGKPAAAGKFANGNARAGKGKGKGKEPAEDAKPRRRVPVTKPKVDEQEGESDDEEEVEEVPLSDEEGEMEEGAGEAARAKDPNAARESHAAQKALAAQRKAAKPHSELLTHAKSLWANVRQKNISRAERQEHLDALLDAVRGHMQDIIFKHDASRVIQSIVKWGGRKERDEVASELEGSYLRLATDKYANFLLAKLIRYCPTHRPKIFASFHGHVPRLLLHKYASPVIEDAFDAFASANERRALLRDFYGKEFALFAGGDKEGEVKSLAEVLEAESEAKRERVLENVRTTLQNVFDNPDKGAVGHTIVHRAMWEYMTEVAKWYSPDEADKKRRDLLEGTADLLVEIIHTKYGSRVVREFLAQGNAKDRKTILKNLKPHVERIATDDQAQYVLFTAFDVIDDTKNVKQSLIADLGKATSSLALDKQGRRVLLYLLAPRSPRHFTPANIALIAETDAARERTSKKQAATREAENRQSVSAELLKAVETDAEKLLRDAGASLVVADAMLSAEGADKMPAAEALLSLIRQPYTPSSSSESPDPSTSHIIDLSYASRVYKALLSGGHYSLKTKSLTVVDAPFSLAFAEAFFDAAQESGNLLPFAKGGGAFMLAEMAEQLAAGESAKGKELAKTLGKKEREEIRGSGSKGNVLLLEKLEKLA